MKHMMTRLIGLAVAAVLLAVAVPAQSDAVAAAAGDKYVISAKAGGVNFVSGEVAIVREAGKSGRLLKGDRMEIGDRVSTGADGKAEILLNPGSYLRLGPLSAVEFVSTDLDDLQVRLDSGSGIFEVFATEDFKVIVSTPKSKITLVDSGVYRVDVDQAGAGKIAVWKGKAFFGEDQAAVIKAGREGSMSPTGLMVAKFDRDDKGELETWSKDRAKELAKITARLERNTMRTVLMRSFMGRQWNMYNSFGLWVYDPVRRANCFLPFGWGWGSPYGYGFGNSLWYYNLPWVVYNSNANGPVRSVRDTKPGRVVDGPARPPFAQVQGSSGATGRDFDLVKPGRNVDPLGDVTPVRPASVYVPMSVPSDRPIQDTKPGRP